MRDDTGEWVPGTTTETSFSASVQPISLEDDDLPEGVLYSNRLRVYIPEPDALLAAFDDANADQVVVDDLVYTVEESMTWRGHHTRAVLLRTT